VYPSPQHADAMQAGMAAIAARLQLKTRNLVVPKGRDIAAFAAQLPASAPMFLMFMGGAIELALFTQGLGQRSTRADQGGERKKGLLSAAERIVSTPRSAVGGGKRHAPRMESPGRAHRSPGGYGCAVTAP